MQNENAGGQGDQMKGRQQAFGKKQEQERKL
jgi:hypothetical protein